MPRIGLFIGLVTMAATARVPAAAPAPYQLTITAHAFVPDTITVPSGQRIQLEVRNQRPEPSEFESFDLNREKVVPPGATVTVWIGPLSAGKYKIFDDFNPSTTGWILAGAPSGKP